MQNHAWLFESSVSISNSHLLTQVANATGTVTFTTGEAFLHPWPSRTRTRRPLSATLARYEERLARALAGAINLIDPDVIVLGGGLSNIARLYDTVPRLWPRYVFSDRVDTKLVPPKYGDSSGVRGAAWLWND